MICCSYSSSKPSQRTERVSVCMYVCLLVYDADDYGGDDDGGGNEMMVVVMR